MKRRVFTKFAAICMAAVMLFSDAGAVMAVDTATDEVELAADEQSVSFTAEYAEIGVPLSVDVTGMTGNLKYDWQVGGKSVGAEATYTPTENDLEKFITVTVADEAGINASAELFFSKLPVIYINTENGVSITDKENYITSEFIIQGNSEYNTETTTLYNGTAGVRGRGNSTWSLPKKPYKVKLDKSTNLLGFGKSKHWVLLANFYDMTYMRNKLSYDLSGDLGEPYMQSILTDVVMNGQYIGNYQLCEQIRVDENRVDILNWEDVAADAAKAVKKANGLTSDDQDAIEEQMVADMGWVTSGSVKYNGVEYSVSDCFEIPDIDGGYILEMDEYMDEANTFYSSDGMPMMFNSPEFVNKDMVNYVSGYINAFEDAISSGNHTTTYNGETVHYTDLFDMDSLVDNWIVQEIFFNEDFMKKSTYMYKDSGEKFKMGPVWDMDWSSGAYQSAAKPYDQWQTLYFSANSQAKQWYKTLVQDPLFLRTVHARYWEVRDTYIQDMLDSIDAIYAQVKESGEASLAAWNQGNGSSSYAKEINTFKTWMTNRIAFMDSKMQTYDNFEKEFINSGSTKLTVVGADGNALKADTIGDEAAYDAMVSEGEGIVVSVNSENAAKAELYINGTLKEVKSVTTGLVEFEIESLEEDSVIQVYTYDNKSSLLSSAYIAIQVNEVTEIEVTAPTKTTYKIGDVLDLNGMVVKKVYEDGTKEEISSGVEVTGYDSSVEGEQTLTVSWDGKTATFTVTVESGEVTEPMLTGIEITGPVKVEYTVGEELNTTGMVVKAVYSDGTKKEVTEGIEITGYNKDVIGEQTITVTYEGKTATFKVTVKAASVTINVDSLLIVIDKAEEIDLGDYVDGEAKEKFKEILDYAKSIAENPTTQEAVDAAEGALLKAIEDLVKNAPPVAELPYEDVKKADWFYPYVYDVYVKGLMTGLDEKTFGPSQNLARAQFAVILYRMEGEPVVDDISPFPDVENDTWYTDAVIWAYKNEIITGYTDTGKFGPSDDITREQIATMMFRYEKYKDQDNGKRAELTSFPDADKVQVYAKEALQWCVANGIIEGTGVTEKIIDPQASTIRAVCATIISRYTDLPR